MNFRRFIRLEIYAQTFRNIESERLGGLEVDQQFEFCGRHHREIARLGAHEDAAGVDAGLAIHFYLLTHKFNRK